MELKIARRGPRAGQPFWSCSLYPECRRIVDVEGTGASDTLNAPPPRAKRPVTWIDATLDRPGWTCRYTTAGGSLRSIPGSSELGAAVAQCWVAHTEVSSFPDPDIQRVVGLCRKILQRGAAPPVDPTAESALIARLGLADRLVPSQLPGDLSPRLDRPPQLDGMSGSLGWGASDLMLDPELDLDSDEEWIALRDGFGGGLSPDALRWVVPQASLEALAATGEAIGRRVDFLIAPPWVTPFVVEIDGEQHTHAIEVDDHRDELLEEAGLSVLRIQAQAVRNPERFWVDEVRSRAGVGGRPNDKGALTLLYGPAQVHRCVLALLEAVAAGFLRGSRWVLELHDDLDIVDGLLPPYLSLFAAIDRLWGGTATPREVSYAVNGRWQHVRRVGVSFSSPEPCAPEPPMVSIRLEAGRSAIEQLPERPETPTIVVRSAFLPARIADPVYEGSKRVGVRTEGEGIEEALVFLLRAVFAKEAFREGQLDALFEVIEGRDCAVLLPTGAGKSLIYQLAGLCLPGRTLIVDPLVSLMEDQVEGLAGNGIDRVSVLSSYETQRGRADEILEEISSGEALFVFVSPERIQQQRFRNALRALAQVSPINLAVVDEAHCVSEWGHDFRTAYLNLGRVLREVCRDAEGVPPPLLALTGTASRAVLRDVLIELAIERDSERAVVRPRSFDRPELRYSILHVEPAESEAALLGFLRGLPSRFGVPASDFFRPRGDRTFSGLVFCANVNGVAGIVDVADTLRPLLGAPPPIFSGSTPPRGIDPLEWQTTKRRNAGLFKRNETPLLVSTKAFGMGIDKPNIRYVVHFGIPGSIEGYYQEVGRGGRDRERAECGLVLIEYDDRRAREMLDDEVALESARDRASQIGWADSDDISRQLFFHLRSFAGTEDEAAVLDDLVEEIGQISERRTVEIPMGEGNDEQDARERALHRLVVLGVLRDYLVEWGSRKFVVELAGINADSVVDHLLAYVGRNQPGRVDAIARHAAPCRALDEVEAVEGCARILIEFVYDTVERSRRRSLREMWLAARESGRDPNTEFRRRILDYLAEGDISPTLERLVDLQRFEYVDWQVELSEVVGRDDARELRGNAARLLTSYPDHPGMLLARGFSELADDRGDLSEFVSALEASVGSATSRYGTSPEQIELLFGWLVEECRRRTRPAAETAAVATAMRAGVAPALVAGELDRALAAPADSDAGLLVLALADRLDRSVAAVQDLLPEQEGVAT
jgi:ATP-dependent DNA helicase RecQ